MGNKNQIPLPQMYLCIRIRDADYTIALMNIMKARDVLIGRHRHTPGFSKAGSKIQRPFKRQAIEDVTKKIKHDQMILRVRATVQ